MAEDFGTAMNEWLNKVEHAAVPTTAEQGQITGAGAKVFAESLREHTPRSNIDYGLGGKQAGHAKQRKFEHLQDSITYEPGILAGGQPAGSTDVGFEDHYFDFVARITNNGRKIMTPKIQANMGFADRAQAESAGAIRDAMVAKLKELKGGGDD